MKIHPQNRKFSANRISEHRNTSNNMSAQLAALVSTAMVAVPLIAKSTSSCSIKSGQEQDKANVKKADAVQPPNSPQLKAGPEQSYWVNPLPKWDKSNIELSVASLSSKQTLEHANFAGKRVLVRVDYNVPMKGGVIKNTARIDATLPTLRTILKQGPRCVILICHWGRPGGKFKREDFSLEPVTKVLQDYLKDLCSEVRFVNDCVGPEVEKAVAECKNNSVLLLENLRFHIEETGSAVDEKGNKVRANNEAVTRFRLALSKLGDIFVFEAFGAAHRPHSSVVGIEIAQRVAGVNMATELAYFSRVLGEPKRPFLGIIGGAKVSDKIKVIMNLLNRVDELIIGGGMAYTFKKVIDGISIGGSLFDKEGANIVPAIMEAARTRGVKIHFPIDHVIADRFAADAKVDFKDDKDGIPDGWMALDIGPKSRALNSEVMSRAQTIMWNGPLGVFEFPAFSDGTREAMLDMVKATQRGATTVIGGGDTGAAAGKFTMDGKPISTLVSHSSTGGGSTLVLLEGTMLPGVHMLSDIRDQPPSVIDAKDLWREVQKLRAENGVLKAELQQIRIHLGLEEHQAPPDED